MTKIANVDQTVEPVDSLTPHPRNPNQGDVGSISESIEAHGFYGQVIAQQSSRTILAGEHRWRAAKAAGMAEIPVTWVDVDDDQALRIVLVDNRSAELAFRSPDALVALLQELAQTPLALTGTGYDGDALDELLADLAPPKVQGEDVVSEPPEKPVTQPGDLWELGPHRLLCGDSSAADTYDALLDGPADLLITDPPYGVSYADKNEFLNAVDWGNRLQTAIEGDHQTPEEMEKLWRAAFGAVRPHMAPGASYYVTGPQGGDLLLLLLLLSLRESGFPLRHMIIWAKNNFVLGRSDYNYQHEPVIFGWVKGSHQWSGPTNETSLWQIDKPSSSKLHPTMKPVELFERAIGNSSKVGALVLDPFGGSGTTLIAAENLDRVARLIELDPGYCDVICKRYQGVSGIVPTCDGKPHDFLAGSR